MANKIIETNLRPIDGFVTSNSRYADSTIIYYGDQHKLTFKTYKRQKYAPADSDKFMVVPPNMEFRPDLVSKKAYGTIEFWWMVMEANGIKDVYDLKAGLNLRIPGNIFNL